MNNKNHWISTKNPPKIEPGTEKIFWIAYVDHNNTISVQMLKYLDDEPLMNDDGKYIESIGWVVVNENDEYQNYYTPYYQPEKILAYQEITPPTFQLSEVIND